MILRTSSYCAESRMGITGTSESCSRLDRERFADKDVISCD